MVYSLFIFSFLYSNFKIEYRKKDQFLHLRMFGKLFWIHNLNIKFIMHGFVLFSNFFKKLLLSLTHSHQLGGALCVFTIFTKLPLYSFSMKMKTLKMCFHFLYLNPTFSILKMKTKYKFLNQTIFFWVPLKTQNENKKHFFF